MYAHELELSYPELRLGRVQVVNAGLMSWPSVQVGRSWAVHHI
jgi:hypothetical protein